MDILKETQELYLLQKERVKMDTGWEKKVQKTFPSLNQDIRLLKELLDDLERRTDASEDAGSIPDKI